MFAKSKPTYCLMLSEEQQEQEKNQVTIFISVELIGVEREIAFAIHCNTSREFSLGSFADNEHYTYLQALLIQTSPKQDSVFQVHVILPQLSNERKKVLDKLSDYPTKICENKLGRGDVQLALSFLLKKTYNMYNKQLQNPKERMVLQKLLEVISVERDNCNKNQFHLKKANPRSSMTLDKSTISSLQIFAKQNDNKKSNTSNTTLFDIFNKCKTSFGARCLRRWMKMPLQNVQQIEDRLDRIEYFITNSVVKNLIQNELKRLPDLDRLYFVFYKVAAGKKVNCQVSDLMKIYRVVQSLSQLVLQLEAKDLNDKVARQVYDDIKRNVECIGKISKMIEKGIDMNGPRDNEFYVRPETQASLQSIMKEKRQVQSLINQQVFKVSKTLDLEVQKLPSNTHKYVLQASKKLAINKIKQTPGYKFMTAKQTKITFITDSLARLCDRLKAIESSYKNEQQILLKRMFSLVAGYYPVMEELSFILSQLDVLTTIASVVITSDGMWCRPRFTQALIGKSMRHPCVKKCIPNDCLMTSDKTIVLTGPNMGGKSTYIRTVGICTYLAHIGCYVPAVEFESPIIDAIITRVGASDLQVKGISTFMSEMLESSCMLQIATSRSLVLIDELGRGTSTCQGFGIAWSICEYLKSKANPFCLFATHFHQMTRMADEISGVKNMYTTCRVQGDQLKLQYKVQQGKMQKSYGIEVMKLLRFPKNVTLVASSYLQEYECDEEDKSLLSLSEQVRDQVLRVYDEMEEQLSINTVEKHFNIKQQYKVKLKQILEMD